MGCRGREDVVEVGKGRCRVMLGRTGRGVEVGGCGRGGTLHYLVIIIIIIICECVCVCVRVYIRPGGGGFYNWPTVAYG